MPDPSQEPLVHLPLLVRFALILTIFWLIPPLCRRVRIPAAVGLLLAGVALGPSGLHTLPNAAPVAEFFAEIGKLLLMFFAGLEIDLSQFRRTGARSLLFGSLTVALAGFGAELVGLEPIIGAFVAGLAVNEALSESEAKEQLDFLGRTLFIPMFFVSIGFLIDVRVFLQTLVTRPGLVAGIVGGLIVAKFLAAYLTRLLFRYSRNEGHMIWSLSLPQVAATLATAIVAYQAKNADGVRLIDEPVLNTVLVLVVVTSILGPMLTEYFGRQLLAEKEAAVKAPVVPAQTADRAAGEGSAADSPVVIKVIANGVEPRAPEA
jgi:Kef-type K+ transport system membrane component KefB